MNISFRDLNADEIEVRVNQIIDNDKTKGVTLLLYKDARCDMNILDETVGAMDWQRKHTRDNANCIVSIWDSEKRQWIEKEDTGTESNTEKEKGLASDSFKRACTNWGIGRELYTAPFIFVTDCELKEKNGKKVCYDKFVVKSVTIQNKTITALKIKNAKSGKTVFEMKSQIDYKSELKKAMNEKVKQGMTAQEVVEKLKMFNSAKEYTTYTDSECQQAIEFLKVLE